MTKIELDELLSLRKEIEGLVEEIQNLPTVTDVVTGSMDQFPYIKHHITIQGIDEQLHKEKQKELGELKQQYASRVAAFEDWLKTVPDAQLRIMLRKRYRDGLSYGEIGEAFEVRYEKSTIARRVRKFLAAL